MELKGLSRAQVVHGAMKDMIRQGQLIPGQRVRESEIADAQGVSRTPVREAMNLLLSEGLLEFSAARGMAVTELSKQRVNEIYALREFLEGASARFAAQHASLPEMRSMEDLLEQAKGVSDPLKLAHLNKLFHALTAEAAHNDYLSRALGLMADWLLLIPGTTYNSPGRVDEIHQEHGAILTAIIARDAEAAENAARQHIRNAAGTRLRVMFGQG